MTALIVWVAAGDSTFANRHSPFFQYLNETHVGDAGDPAIQASCTYYSGNIIARNMAVSGTRFEATSPNDLKFLVDPYIDPAVANKQEIQRGGLFLPPDRVGVFSCGIGSNDAATSDAHPTVPAYAAAVAALCAARKPAFRYVVMQTLFPRDPSYMPEVDRLTYNALLQDPVWRANHGIDGIFDFASHPIMGDPASLNVPDLFNLDRTHPTEYGYSLFVPLVASTMASFGALP